MLLGIGSYMFRYAVGTDFFKPKEPLNPVTLVEKAKEFKVDLVQFAENLPLDDYNDSVLIKAKEKAQRLNIKLEVGTAGATEKRLTRYLEIANLLEANLLRITIHSSDCHPTKEEAINVLRKVLPAYEASNVAIALENHFTMSSEDLVDVVKQVNHPLVGVCLDTANSIVQQEWPMETVHKLGDHANSLHLKDYKISAHPRGIGVTVEGAPLGEGDQNINAILDYVKEKQLNVNVILEQWMPEAGTKEATIKQEEEWVRKSVEAARKFLEQRT